MLIEHMWLDHKGRVTIFWASPKHPDYSHCTSNTTQRHALEVIAKDGTFPGFYVTGVNSRDAGQPWPDEMCKAKRFCDRNGLPFRDVVWFPARATYEEAEADQALEPDLPTEVQSFGNGPRHDNTWGQCWRSVLVR